MSRSRAVVAYLVEERGMVDVESASAIVGISTSRIRAYLTQLVDDQVLVPTGDRWQPGPRWEPWRVQRTNTKPMRATAVTADDEHGQRVRRAEIIKTARGDLSVRRCAVVAGVDHAHWIRIERARKAISYGTLVRLLRAVRIVRGGPWWN